MLTKQFSFIALAVIVAWSVAGTPVNAADAFRSAAHEQYAARLWSFIHGGSGYAAWRAVPAFPQKDFGISVGKKDKCVARGLPTNVADGVPHGAFVVTEQYDADGKNLLSVTAWYKREFGTSRASNYWHWVTWTPEGKLLATAGDDPALARRGFIVAKQNDGLWIFRANQPELVEFTKSGTLAKSAKAEKAGPGGSDLKGADEATLLAYQVSCDELAVLVIDERIWVFVPGSAELAEFVKNGELAKVVSRIGEGPQGITVKAPEASLVDDYLRVMHVKPATAAK